MKCKAKNICNFNGCSPQVKKYKSTNIKLINQHKFCLQILQYVEYNTSRITYFPLFDIAQCIKKSPFLYIFVREDYDKSHARITQIFIVKNSA